MLTPAVRLAVGTDGIRCMPGSERTAWRAGFVRMLTGGSVDEG